MNKFLLIIGLILLVSGCSTEKESSTLITDKNHPYYDFKIGTVLDKLEDYKGQQYVIEAHTDSGAMRGEVSKTEFERATIGEEVYYKVITPLAEDSIVTIIVPQDEIKD